MNHAHVALAIFDRDMRYVAASERWLRHYDLERSAVIGRSHYDVVPDTPARWKAIYQRCLAGERAHADEDRFTRPDGSEQWLRWDVQLWLAPGGDTLGLIVLIEDVTARKQEQIRIEASEAALEAEVDAMRRLHRLAMRSVTSASLTSVLAEVVDTAVAIAHADFGSIQLLDQETGDLHIVAQRGFPDWWIEFWEAAAREHGACGTALQQGCRVIVDDVETSSILKGDALEVARRAGVRAVQFTPLIARDGRTVGLLSTHYRRPHRPNDDELRLLDLLARQAADIVDQVQACEAVRAAEEQRAFSEVMLRAAVEATTDAVVITDGQERVLLANAAFARFHRIAGGEGGGKTIQTLRDRLDIRFPSGEPVPVSERPVPRALRGETAVGQEFHLGLKGTDDRWIGSYSLAPIRDVSGGIRGAVVIGRDITQEHATLQALRASETRYRDLAEQIPDAIFVVDADGRLVDANQAACLMAGLTIEEMRTRLGKDFMTEQAWSDLSERVAALSPGEVLSHESAYSRPDGSTFVGELFMRRLPDGRLQGVVRDISERRRAEDAIRGLEAERRSDSETLQALLNTATQAIIKIDDGGRIRFANPALESMLGWAPGELIGLPHDVLIPESLRDTHVRHQASYWQNPHPGPMVTGLDLSVRRKDGTTLPVEVSLAPVTTPHGRAVFAFVSDISARRREEEARVAYARQLESQTRRLRELATELTLTEQRTREELSRTLHDGLQQSLFAVKLTLDRAQQRIAEGYPVDDDTLARARHDLRDAITEARSLAVELAPPMLREGDLPAVLTWLAQWVHQKYGMEVDLAIEASADPADLDLRTLVFVSVRELLFNVVKHANVTRAAVELRLDERGQLQLRVTDQGVGFDVHRSTELTGQGSGLGLLGIRERLALVGGELSVDTAPGLGTRLTMTVPLRGSKPAPLPPVETAPQPPSWGDESAATDEEQPVRVLIADDHPIVREGLRELLGHHRGLLPVGEAADGLEAIARTLALHPDVVLMDVSMPGIDGIEATRRIHAELPRVQIFALSTHPRPAGGHPIEAAGASRYFNKGNDAHELIAALLAVRAAQAGERPSSGGVAESKAVP